MSDSTKTQFEKMGTSAAHATVMSDASPNLKFRPKGGASGGAPMAGGTGIRQGIQERLGAKYAPQVNMVTVNQPEASEEFRNVKLVPSAVGNRDFYARRAYGQTGDFG